MDIERIGIVGCGQMDLGTGLSEELRVKNEEGKMPNPLTLYS